MAILGMDGFDQYADAAYNELLGHAKYTPSPINAGYVETSSTITRFGTGKSLKLYHSATMIVSESSWSTTLVMQFAFYRTTTAAVWLTYISGAGGLQCALQVDASGYIKAYRYNSILLETSASTYAPGVWHFIEMKIVIDNTTGVFNVNVNGEADVIDFTGDTENVSSLPKIEEFQLTGQSSSYMYYDDLAWQDGSGVFLGDSRIETFMPQTDSGTPDWLQGTSATDNADLVDEIGANDDTGSDYVYSATVDDLDLYDVGALTDADTIHAVGIHVRAKKTDTGDRSIETRTKSGTDEQGGVDFALPTDYESVQDVFEVTDIDGAGTTAWTKALFDAAQFGVKVTV